MKMYEKMSHTENLGWCKPYTTSDGRFAVAVCEGDIVSMLIKGVDIDTTPETIKALAATINEDYSLYRGCSDCDIALDAMTETGCASCPWRDCCECMVCDEE